jgi:hypothetical protein
VERLVVVQPGELTHPPRRDPRAGLEKDGVGRRQNLDRSVTEDLALGERSTSGQVRFLHAAPESLRVDVIGRR